MIPKVDHSSEPFTVLKMGLCLVAALSLLWSHSVAAVEAHRLTAEGGEGVLWIYEPVERVSEVVVVMPGAHISADRYMWLEEGLSSPGRAIVLVEADRTWRAVPGAAIPQPARLATIRHLLGAYDVIQTRWPDIEGQRITLIGHSLGGSVILEALDGDAAQKNPWAPPPAGFTRVSNVGAVVVLGASLQSTIADIKIPYRTDSGPLFVPAATRVLFIAAEHDLLAPPAIMQKTAARYQADVAFELIKGGNHLAWGAGPGVLDRPDLDGVATITEPEQLERTTKLIRWFLGPAQ